jgi:hypothetical protein
VANVNPSVFTIASVVSAAGVATFTGSITEGTTPLVLGGQVFITGCTTSGLNGRYIITGGNLTTTFTIANNVIVTESESGAFATSPPAITIVSITKVVGVTTTGTYTCVILAGPNLIAGTPIIIQGCTTAAFNGDFIIQTVSGTPTTQFTCTIPSTTHTDNTESGATGVYDPEAVQTGAAPSAISSFALGYGINRSAAPTDYETYPYANFIPGTITGGTQGIIDF